jgi:putative phosphoribosyl transferase
MQPFMNRAMAGRELALLLQIYRGRDDIVVLALPRGGVPVAFEVAHKLAAPLDVMLVRKLGTPGQPELAMGAIASGDVVVANEEIPPQLSDAGRMVSVMAAERQELHRRENLYREGRNALDLDNHLAILVDDGAATGSTMQAAVRAVRKLGAREIVVALPVAAVEAYEKLRPEAERVVCINTPMSFAAVSCWYEDFGEVSDAEVCNLLTRASQDQAAE